MVLKDPTHHSNVNLSDFTEHDGYSVVIDEFTDEKDLCKGWMISSLSDWSRYYYWVECREIWSTYAIVRCRTLVYN